MHFPSFDLFPSGDERDNLLSVFVAFGIDILIVEAQHEGTWKILKVSGVRWGETACCNRSTDSA